MAFTSFSFLLFAAAVIAAYYLVPKKLQWWVLLIASYVFYLTADVRYLVFIVLTTVTTYFTALHMGKTLEAQDAYLAEHKKELSREEKKEYKARVKSANRKWMLACLIFNFGMLAICKAALVAPFKAMMSGTGLSFLSLGLPMGISFYMFQSMGYMVDVQRGTCKAEKSFFKLALFVSFFPQLVQGPISKILSRMVLLGALLLSVVAISPILFQLFTSMVGVPMAVSLGGTSLIILVGVALETVKQLESQMMMRHYKGFLY